ncbi:hypothetical protein QFZ51_005443 [Chitinophaga sp. W3I9]|uniref:hypothetical protein n=1 Tax=Chitinophaga sp. W3I9 TaxID=3373924 RepID=UPI003D1A1335
MKKAKFALTAVAILAVVGGALAFKASRNFDVVVYTQTISQGTTYCTFKTLVENATITGAGATFTTKASLAPTTAPCPVITLRSNL